MIPANNKHSSKTLSIDRSKAGDRRNGSSRPSGSNKDAMQGEGNYAAARHYNEGERRFVASGKVPASEAENQAMFAAEEDSKDRAEQSVSGPAEAPSDLSIPSVGGKRVGRRRR